MPRLRSLVLAALVAAVPACSSGHRTAGSPPPPGGPPAFTVTGVDVRSAGVPPPPFPDDVRARVVDLLDRYLDQAVVGPLRSGDPAGDLGGLFTAPALAAVGSADRPALVDEGLPGSSDLRTDAATARLGALLGPDNSVVVVVASLDLRLRKGGGDPVTVARSGDLVLIPDGPGWKIDGYDVRTARDSGSGPTTTAAHR